MFNLEPLAVFPVLVGPLQTLLALLPAILVGVGSMLFAALKPRGFLTLVKFCWRQKLFLVTVACVVAMWQTGWPMHWVRGHSSGRVELDNRDVTDWDSARGGLRRLGRGPGDHDPTAPGSIWGNTRDKTIFSSPAVSGDRLIFATATDIGPFNPTGRGAVVCVDAATGHEVWRYAPDNYRATFSSPVASGNVVVCGEGLHQVDDARITCLDLRTGLRKWEFRTNSHVEATAAIADGRVFIGAGSDGFYCLAVEPDTQGQPKVLWRLKADEFPDCESSAVVQDGVVYFGLGEGGNAVCAVDAETGNLLWKVPTPYPVFAPPSIAEGKLYIATGNGNYVQSAADLLEMKLQVLRDDNATEEQLAEARVKWKPVGEVWCIDLATRAVEWRFTTGDAILGAIVLSDDCVYFGSRDGNLYRVSKTGDVLNRYDLHEPLIASPAVGHKHVYCSTASGRLFCLEAMSMKPAWDSSLGPGMTFSSSPVIAHGHVYIGTAESGLRCLGRPGAPEMAIWSCGESGGSADEVPVPEVVVELGRYPETSESPFHATAPLMVLDHAIYAAGMRMGRTEFIKLDVTGTALKEVWAQRFQGQIVAAPVGCGQKICLVESRPTAIRMVHCLATDSGEPQWSQPLLKQAPGTATGITLDRERVYLWSNGRGLISFELATGTTLWQMPAGPADEPHQDQYYGFGTPVAAGDLLIAITVPESDHRSPTAQLAALDAQTGACLWAVKLADRPTASPRIEGTDVIVPHDKHLGIYSLIDGSFRRTLPHPEVRSFAVPDSGNPVTPTVMRNGRVYYGTDRGDILCLGASSP